MANDIKSKAQYLRALAKSETGQQITMTHAAQDMDKCNKGAAGIGHCISAYTVAGARNNAKCLQKYARPALFVTTNAFVP